MKKLRMAVVDENVEEGYCLYILHSSAPVLLYFHGNGEIVTNYDGFAFALSLSRNFFASGRLSSLWLEYRQAAHHIIHRFLCR